MAILLLDALSSLHRSDQFSATKHVWGGGGGGAREVRESASFCPRIETKEKPEC